MPLLAPLLSLPAALVGSLPGAPPADAPMSAPPGPGWLVVVLLAGLGAAAGAGARELLGRLRRGARVPPPWCEIGVALLWTATAAAWAAGAVDPRRVPLLLGLAWLAVAGAAVDLRHHRLPDALTLPALPAALLLAAPLGGAVVVRAAAGAVVLAAVHAVVHLAAPRSLGAGDVKLAAPVGAVMAAVSWPALLLGGLLAAVLTGVIAALGLAARRLRRTAAVPHGPAMLAAGWLVLAGAASLPVVG